MYFNATEQSAKIWLLTVLYVIASYESFKYLLQLFYKRELRLTMFILFGSVVYSHYYSFWGYVNYYNDDFYSQFYHQMFFTFTELCSTFVVLQLADVNVELSSGKLLVILDIAALHGTYNNIKVNYIILHLYSYCSFDWRLGPVCHQCDQARRWTASSVKRHFLHVARFVTYCHCSLSTFPTSQNQKETCHTPYF